MRHHVKWFVDSHLNCFLLSPLICLHCAEAIIFSSGMNVAFMLLLIIYILIYIQARERERENTKSTQNLD